MSRFALMSTTQEVQNNNINNEELVRNWVVFAATPFSSSGGRESKAAKRHSVREHRQGNFRIPGGHRRYFSQTSLQREGFKSSL